jgi:signal peptidase I
MKATEPVSVTSGTEQQRFRLFRFVPQDKQWLLLLCIMLSSIASYYVISRFVLMSVEIQGVSMTPTLLDGDRYLLYRCAYLFRSPRQGEIVVIRDPQDHGLSIKRIVALPDDTVEIRWDGVYVNQTKLREPYLTSAAALASGELHVRPTKLGSNSYFVLGDNRSKSFDSRYYGPIRRDDILGYISK